MSKGNIFLGQARGKVGDVVLYRSSGEQITRSRNRHPSNPKTDAQLVQRILMSTIGNSYGKMRAIVDHSFEGVQPGAATMAAYMSANLNALRQRVTTAIQAGDDLDSLYAFAPIGSNVFAPNTFIISKGTLPVVTPNVSGDVAASLPLSANNYARLLEQYGLQRGDQLTFISIDVAGLEGNVDFWYTRVILDPTNPDGTPADLTSAFVSDGAINLPNPRNEGSFAALSWADGAVSYDQGALNRLIIATAIIVSRKGNDGKWRRSEASLVLNTLGAQAMGGLSLLSCLDRAKGSSAEFLSDLYLNNAGTGNVANMYGDDKEALRKLLEPVDISGSGSPLIAANALHEVPCIVAGSSLQYFRQVSGDDFWSLTDASSSIVAELQSLGYTLRTYASEDAARGSFDPYLPTGTRP